MSSACRRALILLTAVATIGAIFAPGAGAAEPLGKYIVVFRDSVEHPGNLAHAQVNQHDGTMKSFFSISFDGYAVTMPKNQVDQLRRDPRVDYIERDRKLHVDAIPSGISRTFAVANKQLSIDDIDNRNADVDVAVIDTGIDIEVKDLNVAGRVDCTPEPGNCVENSGSDVYSHGTSVASVIGARDNGIGPVGIAPGARLWSVKGLDDSGSSWESGTVRSVDWVTAHASTIEVANMSFSIEEPMAAVKTAIDKSIEAGVVYVSSAGNRNKDASGAIPAAYPDVIAVSAITDYDGIPGGKGTAGGCKPGEGADDYRAPYSSWGAVVDIAAPGTCTETWVPGGGWEGRSGTSFAAPHVAGAAAIIASRWGKNPNNKTDVLAIRNTLVEKGNYGWTDDSGDGIKEPLLDVSNETTFSLLEAPKNTALPAITPGTPDQAALASTTTGAWTNNPAYSYQWQRCNAAGAECVNIAGATSTTYTPVEADVGKTLVSKVTATNSGGQASALSKASGKVTSTGVLSEYDSKGLGVWAVAPGADGNIWYVATHSTKPKLTINRMTTAGVVTGEFAMPSEPSQVWDMVKGPDGNVWFAGGATSTRVGKITPTGTITEYSVPNWGPVNGITAGPDGKLWFTQNEGYGKITTAGVVTQYPRPGGQRLTEIAAGPDGNLWVTEPYGGPSMTGAINKITTSGVLSAYPIAPPSPFTQSGPNGLSWSGGTLWFTETLAHSIGYMTPGFKHNALPKESYPYAITTDGAGNLWFTKFGGIGRMTTAGTLTEYPVSGETGMHIVLGPDGNLWYAKPGSSKIVKATS